MEAIKSYLETMFLHLPNTPDVMKAKRELEQMMEDKYNELIQEGKTKNEATGTVIAEFGNLDDLADTLGIKDYMADKKSGGRILSLEEVKAFLNENSKHAIMTGFGVFLCIICPVGPIMTSGISDVIHIGNLLDAFGVLILFALIAIAVILFTLSGAQMKKYEYFKHEQCFLDFNTTEYVHTQKNSYNITHALLLAVGIILCVFSASPAILIDAFDSDSNFLNNISGASVLIMVAVGVLMIVITGIKMGGYNRLLQLNKHDTVGGNYVDSQKEERYANSTVAAIMSVYWSSVTCLYLIWSFLSFDWHITWIVWPVAGIIHALIKRIWSEQ